MVNQILEIVERYGGPQEINRKAAEARHLDYLMDSLMQNYLEKHCALNLTADAVTRAGIGVVCATNLHL